MVDVWKTIQGEGPFAGMPAVFVRLAGCNLQCPGCDTRYTEGRKTYTVGAVVATVSLLGKGTPLVVITGGEPMRQRIGELVQGLIISGYDVQVETNGTLWDESLDRMGKDFTVVCSPKAGVHHRVAERVKAYKYVGKAGGLDPVDGLPVSALDCSSRPARPPARFKGLVYLQPFDEGDPEKNLANMRACVESCLKFGHVLCVQLHKLPGVELP